MRRLISIFPAAGHVVHVNTRYDGHPRGGNQLRGTARSREQGLHYRQNLVRGSPLFRRGVAATTEQGSQESRLRLALCLGLSAASTALPRSWRSGLFGVNVRAVRSMRATPEGLRFVTTRLVDRAGFL